MPEITRAEYVELVKNPLKMTSTDQTRPAIQRAITSVAADLDKSPDALFGFEVEYFNVRTARMRGPEADPLTYVMVQDHADIDDDGNAHSELFRVQPRPSGAFRLLPLVRWPTGMASAMERRAVVDARAA